MEVKLSPIEAEILCELLGVEETPMVGDISKVANFDRWGGWWLHPSNLVVCFRIGRTILCPLIVSKILLQWWWAWSLVPIPSCMASM